MEKQYLTGDGTASVILRCMLLLSAMLETVVHVVHVPRCSTWEAKMADHLSRLDTLNSNDKMLLDGFRFARLPTIFEDWLMNPTEDWDLPLNLCECVEASIIPSSFFAVPYLFRWFGSVNYCPFLRLYLTLI
jgi:hypothetical protein